MSEEATGAEDSTLLTAWRAGDTQAGEELFRRYYVALLRFFRSKAGEHAFELTQATFLACVEGRDGIRNTATFRAYLFRIARNLLFDHYRGQYKARSDVELSELSCADLSPGIAELHAKEQELALLLRAMRRIPINAQIVLELYYWERLSGREIGEVLGIPEGTVRTRLRDAKHHLEAQVGRLARTPELAQSTVIGFDTWAEQLRLRIARA
ncbi:MAG: RNA polymerase sigma factor [Nannocystaceae bacterium]